MFVVFGIGNPGPKYAHTRHNSGFAVVHAIAAAASAPIVPVAGLDAEGARLKLGARKILLIKPLTYVNRCGTVLKAIHRQLKLPLSRILVVSDDLNLPLGRLRLRGGGSDGGHKGLRSVLAHLKNPDFPRLRVGIGGPGRLPLEEHVLQRFGKDEVPTMREAIARAAAAVRLWVGAGLQHAMSEVNRRDLDRGA